MEYRRIETDELKDYPEADKIYVWQRIIYLACVDPDLKIDINELFKLYLLGPSQKAGMCPPGIVPAPHPAVGIQNDHSAIGEEYADSPNGIYNYCSVVDKESAAATSQAKNGSAETIYRLPKTDPSGNPCKRFLLKQEADHNFMAGPPGFNPLGVPPGTCIAEQIFTNNWGGTLTNSGVSITKQTSSGNVPQ